MTFFDEPQPIWVVNGFLWHELQKLAGSNLGWTESPFFPVSDATSGMTQWQGKPYFIYNQAFRVEHSFYPIKKATFVYSMRSDAIQTIPLSTAIQKILDRGDDAAKDINDYNLWAKTNDPNHHCPGVYFHSIDVFQNEPGKPREGTSPGYVVSTFMVVAKFHMSIPVDQHNTVNPDGVDLSWTP